MIYLIAAICANLCMTFLMRYSEHHNGNCYALNIWNYLAGSLISLLLLQDKSLIWSGNAVTWGAGIVNGMPCRTGTAPDQYPEKRCTVNNHI